MIICFSDIYKSSWEPCTNNESICKMTTNTACLYLCSLGSILIWVLTKLIRI